MPTGAGLGFRRELLDELEAGVPPAVSFFELAPENWARRGGEAGRRLRVLTEHHPFVCHGLSLSLGGPSPLDRDLLRAIRAFMDEHGIGLYTEHLSWCDDGARLYDLLPLPFTEEAVRWTAARIAQAQEELGLRIGIENASRYLTPPGGEMSEAEFIRAVVEAADCLLHLDVNNVYVNCRNFGLDAERYLAELPLERVCYVHVAGHHVQTDGLLIDTHGAAVVEPVWTLLAQVYARTGPQPTCLERDAEFPGLAALATEVTRIAAIQTRFDAASPALERAA